MVHRTTVRKPPDAGWAHALTCVLLLSAAFRGPAALRAQEAGSPVTGPPPATDFRPASDVDAWGVPSRPAVALAEVAGVNLITWSWNYYVRDVSYAAVYPKMWWNNIKGGFEFDGNKFYTNVRDHAYHGSLYFNAGRSNGIGFWGSVPLTLAGSVMWECCAERYPMALNDLVNTTIGGIALGEALHRTSSTVLSNEATGAGRAGREVSGFFLNPVRGFNRIISGRAFAVRPDPTDPDDRTPGRFRFAVDAGYRGVRPDAPFRDDVTGAFVKFGMAFGSPFDGRRDGAFDVFQFDMTFVPGDNNFLEAASVRGNLLTRDLARTSSAHHVWSIVQTYEYDDSDAFQFGDQNLGVRIESLWDLGGGAVAVTRIQGGAILLGTLDSVLRPSVEVPADWNLRRYDYTVGFDARLGAEAVVGRVRGGLTWRSSWMTSVNHDSVNGGGADHWIHQGRLSGRFGLSKHLGAGGEMRLYLRRSTHELGQFGSVEETVPELRLFATWILARGREGSTPGWF